MFQDGYPSVGAQQIYRGTRGFRTSLAAIDPLTSMLEDEQSFKHRGTTIASTVLFKSSEEHKNDE
jgi:hypothetical protein